MPYVRISLMKPLSGRGVEVAELNEQLVDFYKSQQGCLSCHFMRAADGSAEVGRVSLWESEAAADRAANIQRSLSLRSRLHLLVRRGHQERSFLAE